MSTYGNTMEEAGPDARRLSYVHSKIVMVLNLYSQASLFCQLKGLRMKAGEGQTGSTTAGVSNPEESPGSLASPKC